MIITLRILADIFPLISPKLGQQWRPIPPAPCS